jgi:hypothetical protein
LGVHEVSHYCDRHQLQLVHHQQSKTFSVSGHFSLWKKFKGFVEDRIKKNSSTVAYKIAFNRDASAEHAASGSHMLAGVKGSDEMRRDFYQEKGGFDFEY